MSGTAAAAAATGARARAAAKAIRMRRMELSDGARGRVAWRCGAGKVKVVFYPLEEGEGARRAPRQLRPQEPSPYPLPQAGEAC
jgi:hypothetical protein